MRGWTREVFWSSVWLALLAATPSAADTVTKTNHLSVNGVIKQLSGSMITLEARTKSGTDTLQIGISEVESIEFNDTTFNSGAPRKAPGIGPGTDSGTPATPKQANLTDIVVLRGGQRRECTLTGIDLQLVHCGGRDGDYNRRIVLRIILGPR
jgi:hypothetical protein